MKMFVALVSGLLLSSAATAQHAHGASTGSGDEPTAQASERSSGNTAASANADAAGTGAEGDRVVCRRIDRSESRLSRQRVCMTASQWREHNRND